MRFIFVESFDRRYWNGNIARNTKGISGTHTAIMYLAEGLATHENVDVEVVSLYNNMVEEEYMGVKYTNYENFSKTECEYIVTTNNMEDFVILDKLKKFNRIIVICHNELYNNLHVLYENKEKILFVYLNKFVKRNLENMQPLLHDFENMILPNSFDSNDLLPINEEKEKALCFFAGIQRGYKLACEVVKQIPDFVLYCNTYADECRYFMENTKTEKIKKIEGTSKKDIFTCLSKSKYFVYPLINLEDNVIHYDTFGYVVLEALLHGVVVIAPKIAVYEELYGDAICYIDTDDIIDQEELSCWRWKWKNKDFGYPILRRYVEKIIFLENNENVRQEYIQRGMNLKETFSNKTISRKLLHILKNKSELHLQNHLFNMSTTHRIPRDHINYLQKLKNEGFEPKVIYDIGSCVLHWTREASKIWPEARIILFDAFKPASFLYSGYDHYIGCLSDTEDKDIKFYQNDYLPTGNSYYREIGCENGKYFPEDKYIEMKSRTLDSVVKEAGFPLPDFVKIDVQGSEIDIIRGATETLRHVEKMVVDLQHIEYNLGALHRDQSLDILSNLGWKCVDPLFCDNGPDGGYSFVNMNLHGK